METLPAGPDRLALVLAPLHLEERLQRVAAAGLRAVFTSSLGIEDQVITAAIARSGAAIDIVTLDTGRLFSETAALIAETEARYGIAIRRYRPKQDDISTYVARYGRDGFYDSVEARRACCEIRKLRPLAGALEGVSIWVTGVRRGQSGARAQTPLAEGDTARRLVKVNPLADWSLEQVKAYATAHDVPLNPLHARGYASIGCEPCTRALKPGEPERAGRWWWESDQARECGLHVKADAGDNPATPKVRVPAS